MNFTTTLPTEPGFYLYEDDFGEIGVTEIFKVEEGNPHLYMRDEDGDSFAIGDDQSLKWCRLVPADERNMNEFKAGMTRAAELIMYSRQDLANIILTERNKL